MPLFRHLRDCLEASGPYLFDMTDTKHSLRIHHPFPIVNALIPLTLPQHIAVLFQWAADQLSLLPEVWCEETVCV